MVTPGRVANYARMMSPTFSSFHPPARLLLGPGPSDVHPRVLAALARPTIGHLDPAFVGMMDEVQELLRRAFRTRNEFTLPISAPGSAGMEACFVNLVEPGDVVVVCRNGVFGERMRQNVERVGGEAVVVDAPWGRAIDPDDLRRALRSRPEARLVAFVHAETSTGALSDAEALCAVAREHGCLTIVDAVTSLGGVPLEVDAWQIDAIYSGTQKCLSCPPGLAPISFSARAIERIRSRKVPCQSWFFDVALLAGYWQGGARRTYHHTAPVNALYGLHEALLMLVEEEGLTTAWERHRRNHLALREGLVEQGIDFLVPEAERLPQLNAVFVPKGSDEASLRRRLLEEFNIEIGAGLGDLAGKVWRVGLMGQSSSPHHVESLLNALHQMGTCV